MVVLYYPKYSTILQLDSSYIATGQQSIESQVVNQCSKSMVKNAMNKVAGPGHNKAPVIRTNVFNSVQEVNELEHDDLGECKHITQSKQKEDANNMPTCLLANTQQPFRYRKPEDR